MCELCRAGRHDRYHPSVGDVLDVDDIEFIISGWHPQLGEAMHRYRRHLESRAAYLEESEKELDTTVAELNDADEVLGRLRKRLTSTDEAITKDVDRCLTLLAGHLKDTQLCTRQSDELEKILTSLRERYGPKPIKPDDQPPTWAGKPKRKR